MLYEPAAFDLAVAVLWLGMSEEEVVHPDAGVPAGVFPRRPEGQWDQETIHCGKHRIEFISAQGVMLSLIVDGLRVTPVYDDEAAVGRV